MARKPIRHRKRKLARKRSNRVGRFLALTLLLISAAGLFSFLTYVGYLDYSVRKAFEGKRWAIPARVYANPVELYAGSDMSAGHLENHLLQLRYRKDPLLAVEGTYFRSGQSIGLRTRTFRFWDAEEKSVAVKLTFSGPQLADMRSLDAPGPIAILRLEPLQIGSFYPTHKEDRVLVKLEQVPKRVIQGLLATEDHDFIDHFGISPRAILRALWANLRAGGLVQGGSTLTQQLVKNFYLTSERSLWRKINEALMALILETHYDKDEILEAYLNEVYLGQDGSRAIHGFGLASEFYFGRPLNQLKLEEIATLVALVRGPSYYDPLRWPDRAQKRRNLVLDSMAEEGYLTAATAETAKKAPLEVIRYGHRPSNRYPAFLDLVRRQLSQEYRDEDLTSEGLLIFTTLDPEVQEILEEAAAGKLMQLEKRRGVDKLETAAIVTRREGGEVVAMIGARDPNAAGFNRALDAVRPIGSLIKPVIYLTALQRPEKYTITTTVSDTQVRVKNPGGAAWSPKNYDNREHGIIELHTALANSYNLATVRVGLDIGIAHTMKTLRDLGVRRPMDLYPSSLLGAGALTPLEVTQMYQTLAGDGFTTPLRAIRAVLSSDGKPLRRYPLTVRQAVDPAATYIVNTILQEAVRFGTGRSAYSILPPHLNVAGKTGTTNKLRDSWFAGFSGDYLSVVWVGRDDNQSTGLTGGTGALPVWAETMSKISREPVNLVLPDGIEMVWVDGENGLRASETCFGARLYPFIAGSAPDRYSPCVSRSADRSPSWIDGFFR